MKKIVIVTGGTLSPAFALSLLDKEKPDHIIAVDGALSFFEKVGEKGIQISNFDNLVGDFDTISHEILEKYETNPNITIHRFVPEKDYTDTDIAVGEALKLAGDEDASIIIIGAFGGRVDHMLANLQILERIMNAGKQGVIMDEQNRVTLISGRKTIERARQYGKYVSLVPVSRRLTGVTLRGFKYPLTDGSAARGISLLISNEITEDVAEIEIREGLAYLIESRDRQ